MHTALLGFLVLLMAGAPGPLFAAPGDVDTGFGTNGFVVIDINNQQSFAGGLAIQGDGKLVLAGSVGPGGSRDFVVIRGTADGAPDPDFAAGNLVVTSISTGEDIARDVAVLEDGKILVMGLTDLNGGFDTAFARYDPDGTLDSSFGGSKGTVVVPIPSLSVFPTKMAIQTDGRMIVTGGAGSPPSLFVARYQEDGTLDASFDGDGFAVIQPGGNPGIGNAVVVQEDGKIVVAGSSGSGGAPDLTVLRLKVDGSLDTDFDGDGIAIAAFGSDASYAIGLGLQPDGGIVAAGSREPAGGLPEVALVRFLSDGTLDSSFGSGGLVTTPVGAGGGAAAAVALQGNGKILVAGSAAKGLLDSDSLLVRYQPNGDLDADFAGGGLVTADAGANDRAMAVALQSDGRIIVSGQNDGDLTLIGFEGDPPPPPPPPPEPAGGCRLIPAH